MVATEIAPGTPGTADAPTEPPAGGTGPVPYSLTFSEQLADPLGEAETAAAAAPAPPEAEPSAAPEAAEAAPTLAPDPYEWLNEADPKRLRQHPKVAGIVGDLLARERTRLREQLAAELAQDQETQRLRAAAEQEDLITLGEAKLREVRAQLDRERAEIEATRQRTASLAPDSDAYQAIAEFAQQQPPEVLRRFVDPATGQGKTYAGDPATGFKQYLADVVSYSVEHRMSQRETELRARLERELRASLRAELLGERNEREPSPDLTAGAPTNGTVLTLDAYLAMSPRDQKAARKAGLVDAMVAAMQTG